MKITVFCSQYDVSEKYAEAAKSLAHLIGEHGYTLVFGGGDEGLMHVVAESAQSAGSRIVGVIREQIKDKAYAKADEMIVVKDAYAMNLGLIERGDAIAVLPGGIGTLNELTDVLRMIKNGVHHKLVVVLNTDHFYDGLKEQLQRMRQENFLRADVMDLVQFVDTPESAISAIERNVSA